MKEKLPYIALLVVVIAVVQLLGLTYLYLSKPTSSSQQQANFKSAAAVPPQNFGQFFAYEIPEKADFAGEPVPLHKPHVYEDFDAEMAMMLFLHAKTSLSYKRSSRWFPMIEPILKANGIPDDFKYLAVIESNLTNAVSLKQAKGFWQFMQDAGRENGLEINDEVDERYHPVKSTEAACKYLKTAYKSFGSWTLSAASYNMGMKGLKNELEKQKVNSYYDAYLYDETSRYVYRAIAIKLIFQNPEKYGYKLSPESLYYPVKCKEVEVKESIADLVSFAKDNGTDFETIKTYNPWILKERLTVRAGKSYTVLIPEEDRATLVKRNLANQTKK